MTFVQDERTQEQVHFFKNFQKSFLEKPSHWCTLQSNSQRQQRFVTTSQCTTPIYYLYLQILRTTFLSRTT